MQEELKPCGFCQSEALSVDAYSVQPDDFHSAYVECADCGARGPNALTLDGWLSSKEEASEVAIATWNRRTPVSGEFAGVVGHAKRSDDERKAFEAWHGGIYRGYQADIAWAAWRAGGQQAGVPEGCADLDRSAIDLNK